MVRSRPAGRRLEPRKAFQRMLEKTFDPKSVEPRLYKAWEASGAFAPEAVLARNPDAEPFSIVIPPPNVTGSLHIGHALNNTLQDVLTRFERMRGKAISTAALKANAAYLAATENLARVRAS